MSDTRQRILATALEMFNARGVHRVGVRDIARALEMSPGNLSYHFATKDDLVAALMYELHDLGARTVFSDIPRTLSLVVLYESAKATMRNMLAYRSVVLSYVDAVMATPSLRAKDAEMRARRRARHDALVEGLVAGGYLSAAAVEPRRARLFEQGELISSGWIRAAMLEGWTDDAAVVRHYARLGVALLEAYCTAKGEREIKAILEGEFDPPVGTRPERKK